MLESQQTNLLSLSLHCIFVWKKFGANDKLRQQTVGQNGSALPLQTWGEWELSSHGAMVPCFFNELRYMFHGQELNQIIQIQEFDAAKRLKAHHRKLQGHHQLARISDSSPFRKFSFGRGGIPQTRPVSQMAAGFGGWNLESQPGCSMRMRHRILYRLYNTYNMISSTILT